MQNLVSRLQSASIKDKILILNHLNQMSAINDILISQKERYLSSIESEREAYFREADKEFRVYGYPVPEHKLSDYQDVNDLDEGSL